ncbi:MAG: nucleoside-diphosphate sugar epimerase, partial [Leptospirales bacterium]
VLDPHKFKNQEFAVTGPAALSHDSVAEIISEVTGIPIQYDDVAPDQFEAGLIDAGLPADYAAFLVQIAAALKAGRAAPVTSTVEDLTGDPARDFASFAHDYKSEWS